MVDADYVSGPANEFDSYLMVAFTMAQNGRNASDIGAYLSDIAANHMGLGNPKEVEASSRNTAQELIDLARSLT